MDRTVRKSFSFCDVSSYKWEECKIHGQGLKFFGATQIICKSLKCNFFWLRLPKNLKLSIKSLIGTLLHLWITWDLWCDNMWTQQLVAFYTAVNNCSRCPRKKKKDVYFNGSKRFKLDSGGSKGSIVNCKLQMMYFFSLEDNFVKFSTLPQPVFGVHKNYLQAKLAISQIWIFLGWHLCKHGSLVGTSITKGDVMQNYIVKYPSFSSSLLRISLITAVNEINILLIYTQPNLLWIIPISSE